jgi:hypothetical protein
VTLGISDIRHNIFSVLMLYCYAECRDYLKVMLSVAMVKVMMLSVVMLNVVMLSVVAPSRTTKNTALNINDIKGH